MKLKVLGTGSKGNCFCLESNGRTILLDAGIPFKKIREGLGYDLTPLDGVLATHCHADHSKAIPDLVRAGIPLVTSEKTAFVVCGEKPYTLVEMKDDMCMLGTDWHIRSFPVDHDCVDPWGFLIATDNYQTVTMYITDTSHTRFVPKRLDHLIIECNYIDSILDANQVELGDRYLRLKKHHFSLDRVCAFLQSLTLNGLKTITLMHLSATNADPDRMVEKIRQITGIVPVIAKAGLIIDLGGSHDPSD
jgi:phosphoribosyl 1,2-cyclic phosphodiesterase